jgi:hypothetical protein
MKKLIIRIGVAVVALVIIALIVVFFSLNSIVKKGVETVGPSLTKVDVRLGSADISPFSGSGALSKLFVGNPEGYKSASSIEVGSMKVMLVLGSVMSDKIVINGVYIQDAQLTLESALTGKSNLGKILDNLSASSSGEQKQQTSAPETKNQKKFIVKNVVISGTKVNLAVTGVGALPTVTIPEVHLQNIGEKSNGVTAAELVQQVLTPLLQSAIDEGTKAIASNSKQLQNLGKGGVNQLTNVTKGIGNLFNK